MDEKTKEKIDILLVDDEKDFVDAVRSLLEERGFNVRSANDGVRALEMVTENTPDLILLDIVMPKMDGIAFLKKLKAQEKTSKIPVIILTVRDGQANRNIGLEAGAYEYISKPYDSIALLRQVRNILEKTGKLKRSVS